MDRIGILMILLCVLHTLSLAQTKRKDKKGNLEVLGLNGELLEYHLLDENGNFRTANYLGKIVYNYDSMGYLVNETYIKVNGSPYQYATSGVSMKTYSWNAERNNMVLQNYDSLMRRTQNKTIDASIISYLYDSLKRVKQITYFDKDSVRTNNQEGYSRIEYSFTPVAFERYFNYQDSLIRLVDDNVRYLSNLQIKYNSIPQWLRSAKQINRVDGVRHKSLYYEFTLGGQEFDGFVELSIIVDHEDIKSVDIVKSNLTSIKWQKKTADALKSAFFISLANMEPRSMVGTIIVYFKKD